MKTDADATTTSRSLAGPLRVVTDLREDAWRRFVDEHPRSNIFHTPEMFQVFARTAGHHPEVWAVLDGGSNVQALLTPVHITLRTGALQRFTTRSIAYGGVLYRDTPGCDDALRMLLASYAESVPGRSLFTELRNMHDVGDQQRPLNDLGFRYEDHLNYLIALDGSPEEMLRRISPRTRKIIRKGLRERRVTFHEVKDPSELEAWYQILEATYRHVRVPLADRSLFEAAFELLQPRGMARFVLARLGETPIACSVELVHKDTVLAWYGGSQRAHNAHRPNDLLIWHILEWASGLGFRVYDFGGAGKPGEDYGVRDFKAKFGGELVNFGRYVRVHSPLRLQLSKLGFSLYQLLG